MPESNSHSKRQWTIFCVMAFANLFSSVKVSLQGPFYPQEAEKKGATASEYGFVFGIFELTTFLMSPIYGSYIERIGPTFFFKIGVFVAGTSSIAFGFLGAIDDKNWFIGLSLIIRVVESLGATAANTSSFTIIAMEFPNAVASTFASLETFFGLGLILGPSIGGVLYSFGGFTLPFAVMGGMLLICGITAVIFLPKSTIENPYVDPNEISEISKTRHGYQIYNMIKIPGVALACFGTMTTSLSIGFSSGILEPHIRQFSLSPIQVGLFFLVYGISYSVSAPVWGYMCDKVKNPNCITIIGAIGIILGFSLIGPFPFIPYWETTLLAASIGMIFHGVGVGACLPSSFLTGLQESRAKGYPETINTYGLLSGLWVSMFSLGAFIGPSLGGILFDQFGFRKSSLLVIVTQILLITLILIYNGIKRKLNGNFKITDTTRLVG